MALEKPRRGIESGTIQRGVHSPAKVVEGRPMTPDVGSNLILSRPRRRHSGLLLATVDGEDGPVNAIDGQDAPPPRQSSGGRHERKLVEHARLRPCKPLRAAGSPMKHGHPMPDLPKETVALMRRTQPTFELTHKHATSPAMIPGSESPQAVDGSFSVRHPRRQTVEHPQPRTRIGPNGD